MTRKSTLSKRVNKILALKIGRFPLLLPFVVLLALAYLLITQLLIHDIEIQPQSKQEAAGRV